MASSFEQAGAQLAEVSAQQNSLAAAVANGELWMEIGVAERAAARCEQAIEELDRWPDWVHPAAAASSPRIEPAAWVAGPRGPAEPAQSGPSEEAAEVS